MKEFRHDFVSVNQRGEDTGTRLGFAFTKTPEGENLFQVFINGQAGFAIYLDDEGNAARGIAGYRKL